MQNPWKLTTLVLAGALLVSNARAESDWKKDALSHLEKAAAILEARGSSKTGRAPAPEPGAPSKKQQEATPASKALQLTRAAIVHMKRAGE